LCVRASENFPRILITERERASESAKKRKKFQRNSSVKIDVAKFAYTTPER
jgi:hypothetical protein